MAAGRSGARRVMSRMAAVLAGWARHSGNRTGGRRGRRWYAAVTAGCLALGLAACSSSGGDDGDPPPNQGDHGTLAAPDVPATIRVTSDAWTNGQPTSAPYVCRDRGDPGVSPPLSWAPVDAPDLAGFAVTIVDPDAGNFLHWGLLDLPEATTELPEHMSPGGSLPTGASEVRNGAGTQGYTGPCPPPGPRHHYVVTVWALRHPVRTVDELPDAALAKGTLTVLYGRGSRS